MLSNTFKYISKFRHAGHQVGRKVGDMLELLTYSGIVYNKDLKQLLNVEPKLFGFSEAGHKVEFVLHKTPPKKRNGGEIHILDNILGFVECKKVGVEQTVNSQFKKNFKKNPNGQGFIIPFENEINVNFNKTNKGKTNIKIKFNSSSALVCDSKKNLLFEDDLKENHRIICAVFEDGEFCIIKNSDSLRSYNKELLFCRILDIFEIRPDCLIGVLNDCLSGPQTPEKAKQASFVALDVRKKRFNSFDLRENEKEMLTVLVLTEFSH